MASVHRRGEKWAVRWRDLRGRQRSKDAPDQRTARRIQRQVEASLAAGRDWDPRESRGAPDLDAVTRAYVARCARVLAPRTALRYAHFLDLFLAWLRTRERTAPVPEVLTEALLEEYHAHLRSTGLHGHPRSGTTARKHVEAIQLLWRWAWDHNDQPGWDVIPQPRRLELPRRPRPAAKAPTWAEADLYVAACRGLDWLYRDAVLGRALGTRLSETCLLDWSDVDLDAARLTLRPETTKGGYGGRTLPMPPWLMAEMAGWGVREGRVVGAPEYVLRHGGGTRQPVDAWKRSGVAERVWRGQPTHALRKCWKSGMLALGFPKHAVDLYVGHSLGQVDGAYIDPDVAADLVALAAAVPAPADGVAVLQRSRPVRSRGDSR